MLADELVWVKDAGTAVLMRWNGTAWANVAQLAADQYRLDTSGQAPITDLRLPFALLGVANPSRSQPAWSPSPPMASALRVWAALPNAPGLNSALVNGQGGAASTNTTVVLLHQYLWPALDSGSVPNTGQYIDTDMEVWITADQEASTFSAFDPELDELWDVVFDDAGSGDPADELAELDPGLPRVGNGQQVHYTIHYVNHGTATAKGVTVSLEAWRSLRLQGAAHEVDPERGGVDWIDVTLGDIGPGASGTRSVVGTINTANVAAECSLTRRGMRRLPTAGAARRADLRRQHRCGGAADRLAVGRAPGRHPGAHRSDDRRARGVYPGGQERGVGLGRRRVGCAADHPAAAGAIWRCRQRALRQCRRRGRRVGVRRSTWAPPPMARSTSCGRRPRTPLETPAPGPTGRP